MEDFNNPNTDMTCQSIEKDSNWLSIEKCSADDCTQPVTYVIFLNTPTEHPYIVGSCSKHKRDICDFGAMKLDVFTKKLQKLRESGIAVGDLKFAVADLIDPILKTSSAKSKHIA